MNDNYNDEYNEYKAQKGKSPKRIMFLILLIVGGILANNHIINKTMLFGNTYTDDTFTIQTPKSVEYVVEDGEEYYVSESSSLHVDWRYLYKDYGLTLDDMMPLVFAYWFPEGEYGEVEDVVINDREAKKLQYKCLQVGLDGIHYYYSGYFVIFELNSRFVVADIYYSVDESEGIDNDLSSSQVDLLNQIVDTIVMEDNTPDFPEAKINKYKLNSLRFTLSDAWVNDTEGGEYYEDEYGKYSYYQYTDSSINMQCSDLLDDGANDLEKIKENLEDQTYEGGYSIIGEDVLNGEPCLLIEYNSVLESGGEVYLSGVFAISEHYYMDIFVYTVTDDYQLSEAMQREIVKDLLD